MKIVLLVGVIFTMLLSFNEENLVREGYYYASHGRATGLIKIKGNKIQYFADNVVKSWGYGTYEVDRVDSLIKVSYIKIWKSKQENLNLTFERTYKLKWNKGIGAFELQEYEYREKSEAIKDLMKRVKSSCKVKANN
jgi:hypothetical protein